MATRYLAAAAVPCAPHPLALDAGASCSRWIFLGMFHDKQEADEAVQAFSKRQEIDCFLVTNDSGHKLYQQLSQP